jgi:hypothetical protein
VTAELLGRGRKQLRDGCRALCGLAILTAMPGARDQRRPAFERLEASLLACPKCKRAVAVRKRLLLILPEGDKYEYVCPHCGSTCGSTIQQEDKRTVH